MALQLMQSRYYDQIKSACATLTTAFATGGSPIYAERGRNITPARSRRPIASAAFGKISTGWRRTQTGHKRSEIATCYFA